jgi:hypothetical protein
MDLGDVYSLSLAVEAAEADAESRAASEELARLEGVARRFGTPGPGSEQMHFEEAESGWVAHTIQVDAGGRLTIKTRASPIKS